MAFAASALLGRDAGLVTQVGGDFDPASLRLLPIDTQGVAVTDAAHCRPVAWNAAEPAPEPGVADRREPVGRAGRADRNRTDAY